MCLTNSRYWIIIYRRLRPHFGFIFLDHALGVKKTAAANAVYHLVDPGAVDVNGPIFIRTVIKPGHFFKRGIQGLGVFFQSKLTLIPYFRPLMAITKYPP